ncbi:hypothetical protein JS533_013355 [Bifidobacterium amazonense]|uniref:Uncharacterized protein n=1 Tax=Bifidobacterium amazonense TaxID=2809027 RepID=A0ABS9VYV3_9BIFI|nr:hypothetical protein [Bifidobacterium amazonense]MCH9277237.1 hypothetical protein [Bifidobacterium amazonense]
MIIAGLAIIICVLYAIMLIVMLGYLAVLGMAAALAVGVGIGLGVALVLAVEGLALIAWNAWSKYRGRTLNAWVGRAGTVLSVIGGVWFLLSCALMILLASHLIDFVSFGS